LAPLGLDAIMTGLVVVTLVLWPVSVRQACGMLSMTVSDYVAGLRGPALSAFVMAVSILTLRDMTAEMGDAARLSGLIAAGAVLYGLALAALSRRRLSDALGHIRQSREATA
jgi:hypothetical protein